MARPISFTDRSIGTPTYTAVPPPAAGAPVLVPVPTGTVIWRVNVVHVDLVTVVGGLAREVFIDALVNGTEAAHVIAAATQAGSTTIDYTFGIGLASIASGTSNRYNMPLIDMYWLAEPGDTNVFTIDATNMNAGDQFGNVYVWFQQWRQ